MHTVLYDHMSETEIKVSLPLGRIAEIIHDYSHNRLTQFEWLEWLDDDERYYLNKKGESLYDNDGNVKRELLSLCSFPVRLQVLNGDWEIHYFDPSWDSDHRGYWAYSYIFYNMTKVAARDIARELIHGLE